MASLDCPVPEAAPSAKSAFVAASGTPFCDPLKPVKSSAQSAIEGNLGREVGALNTFSLIGKTGDVVVPANVHIRFYNCEFDSFDASQGNNMFYFEQCVFNKPPLLVDAVAIVAGTTFTQGATIRRSQVELIPHDIPGADPVACNVNDTFTCEDHSFLKSSRTNFEWLGDSYRDVDDDAMMEFGFLKEAAEICGQLTAAVSGIVGWATKSILKLLNFSKFESMLDKFLNIDFTILNMVDGCVAYLSNMAFGILDSILAPLFQCVNSIVSMLNNINSLISLVKSIPDRIANLADRCYLRIVDTAQLIANRAMFTLDTMSRLEVQLNQRIIALNGAVANLTNSSKMVLRNCGVVVSPTSSNLIPMIKVDSRSTVDISRIKFVATARASMLKVMRGSKAKLKTVSKVESTAPAGSGEPIVDASDSTVETDIAEMIGNCTLFKGVNSKMNVLLAKGETNCVDGFVFDYLNCRA